MKPELNIQRILRNRLGIGHDTKCPCGSGKKYKECCMYLSTTAFIAKLQRGKDLSEEDTPLIDRVITEKKELGKKIGKLAEFMQSPEYTKLTAKSRDQLNRQAKAMVDYSGILTERWNDLR